MCMLSEKDKKLLMKKYLEKIRPHFNDLIDYLENLMNEKCI